MASRIYCYKKNTLISFFKILTYYSMIPFIQIPLQFILFFIEDSITELNINTATRESSIYGLAALAGHNPTRSIAAKGEIVTKWNGKGLEDIGGGAVLIPNNSQVKCINNGKTYLLKLGQEYVRLNLDGTSTLSASIIEGVLNTNQYTGTGGKLQSYNISARGTSGIENFEVDVRVNGNTWKKYDSLYDIPRNSRGYMVKSSLISGIDVFFGTVDFGFPPPPLGGLSSAAFTTRGFLPRFISLRFSMASIASSRTGISTKPKPLLFPVSLSIATLAVFTCPNFSKISMSSASSRS
jgi:hypothetical protein